jgi:hypothetical protein
MSDLLNSASLVVIPSGYKEDTVYSVVPTDGSGDLSFTRASNGTRVNSAGLVEVCPWNLVQQSETLSVSPWGTADVTITDNSQTAPNGTSTADVLTEGTGTAQHRIYQTTSFSSGIYTVSAYVKNITGTRQAYIDLGPFTAFFTFSTETIYSASGVASFEKLANGWYRISLTSANPITPSTIYVGLGQGNTETYTGNGTSAIAFWGIQYNIGSTAKPYFPTTDRLNVPRLTYQNGGGGCPSLLLEKQSTNLITYSQDFGSGSNWSKTNQGVGSVPTITANYAISPDGTQNATRFVCNLNGGTSTNDRSWMLQSFTAQATDTISIWIKLNSSGTKTFIFSDSGGNTKTISGTDWQRIDTSFVGASGEYRIGLIGGLGTSDTLDCCIWGAQAESGDYPTSYISTQAASATRVADVCVKTGISSLIGQTEGVAFIDFDFNGNYSSGGIIPFSLDGGAGNELYAWIQTNGTVIFEVYNAFVGQVVISGSIGAVGRKKIAFAYKQNDFAVYLNGTQVGTDTSGTVPTMSRLFVGKYYANDTYNINAGINQTILFPTRLTNAELASLTTI